ncbi:MAG: hypothetical protein V4604_00465 [Bacteroidota bacterium]
MKNSIFLLLTLTLSLNSFSQKEREIGFYNVENLFDTIDGINDDAEFLPSAKTEWNLIRYEEKLAHINQVFELFSNPLMIGMCEVENEAVVRDVLLHSKNLKRYGVVHYESPDARGIDVALIYDSLTLKLVDSGKLRFVLPGKSEPSTRDIVWGKFAYKKDTIIGMVNHWPSRRGGETESDTFRLEAAKTARVFVDSLLNVNSNYKIIAMGDLNDYPTNDAPKLLAEKLPEMITKASGDFGGSYNYKSTWDVLDHIMVSPGFMKKKGVCIVQGSGKIYSPEFLMSEYKEDKVPFRTYAGTKYLGGYSDHLPVSVKVILY